MAKPALMIQGTGSHVGKSLIVAGLCRLFARRGLAVRPFKPQNMSNNAAATPDGGEIGRAQALQARAARIPPSIHMNPVLLKPQSETGAQVILQGRMMGTVKAADYQALKAELLPKALASFAHLESEADFLLVEGAGSPAEINLRPGDIANMGFARAAGLPVVIVGDIDRGGVIASLVGTAAVIDEGDRALMRGFIVNKFRGDPQLFGIGRREIESRTGWADCGLLPWFASAIGLPAEDSLALDAQEARVDRDRPLRIAIPRLPHIANFDDLDPLSAEPDVALLFLKPGEALPGDIDLVILPGSKASLADLAALRAAGWDIDIRAHHRRGGCVLGLCGGYQMLGRHLADPLGIEGPPGEAAGLGLLDIATELTAEKRVRPSRGRDRLFGHDVAGYEIHIGRSHGPDGARPFLDLESGPDGAISADHRVFGSYLHGLFAADDFRHAFLNRLRRRDRGRVDFEAGIERILDALADHLEAHLAIDRLWEIAHARR